VDNALDNSDGERGDLEMDNKYGCLESRKASNKIAKGVFQLTDGYSKVTKRNKSKTKMQKKSKRSNR